MDYISICQYNFVTLFLEFDKMLTALKENSKIWFFEVDENVPQEKFEDYLKTMKSRKDPRNSKKKKKKVKK